MHEVEKREETDSVMLKESQIVEDRKWMPWGVPKVRDD